MEIIKVSTKHINENYMHDCGCEKLELKNCVASITEMGFSENQVVDLLDFYLFHAPTIRVTAIINTIFE